MGYDLSKSKKFKVTMKQGEYEDIYFENDLPEQVKVEPKGKDLVITAYAQKNGEVNYKKVLGTITLENGAKSENIPSSIYFHGDNYYGYVYNYVDDPVYYNFLGSKKAQTIVGSDFNEVFWGGDKNDKITTGGDQSYTVLEKKTEDTTYGGDIINGGKGDDTITVNGYGIKYVDVDKGDGNDTINIDFSQPIMFTASESTTYSPEVMPVGSDLTIDATIGMDPYAIKKGSGIKFTYTKRGADMIISAEHKDGTTESLTVKNYFNLTGMAMNTIQYIQNDSISPEATSPVNFDLIVNDKEVKEEILPYATLNIAGVPVKELIKMVEKEFPSTVTNIVDGVLKKVKLPSSFSNANIYIGTETDNVFEGSKKKDIMISTGGYNEYTTGKDTSIIASLGNGESEWDWDEYNVSSFEAGTAIIDKDGQFDVTLNNVNTNDIHMISTSGMAKKAAASIGLTYFTDSKGVKNIAGVDFNSVYEKIMDIKDAFSSSSVKVIKTEEIKITSKQAKAINSALTTASNLIDKFRGVGIVSSVGDSFYEDRLTIYDTEGNAHYISPESVEAYSYLMSESLYAYSNNISKKFNVDMDELPELLIDPSSKTYSKTTIDNMAKEGEYIDKAFVNKYFKKLNSSTYILSNAAIKEIKNGLSDAFTNSYIGTDKDNSFSISHSDAGAVIAGGTGSDTFTFNGEIGTKFSYNKPGAYNPANPPVYNIVSSDNNGYAKKSSDAVDKDTIVFKNYTMEKDLFPDIDIDMYDLEVDGISFWASKYNKNSSTYGQVRYYANEDGGSYDLENNKLALTVKDKKSTYEITAEHRYGSITEDWSDDKANHYAVVRSNNTTITTGKGQNMVESYGTTVPSKGTNPTLTYNYGGGKDEVISNDVSYDTYNAELTKKSDLIISDRGYDDYDQLVLSNDDKSAANIRMYFNVNKGSLLEKMLYVSGDNIALVSGKLSKSSFDIESGLSMKSEKYISSSKSLDGVKNGIEFNYNTSGDDDINGIEDVYINNGDSYVDMKEMMNDIRGEVAGWLSKHDYYSTDDAIANGSAKEVKELLNIYNSYTLDNYTQVNLL